jgi:glycosyltransferase involved in cell wall biosynthesis
MAARKTMHMVCVMPPPVTGMTTVSEAMAHCFAERYDVRDYKITRPAGISSFWWSVTKHLRLIAGAMKASARANPSDVVYLTPDSGKGLLGSVLMVAVLALARRKLLIHHHVFSYVRQPSMISRLYFGLAGSRAKHIVLCSKMDALLQSAYGSNLDTVIQSNAALVPAARDRPNRDRVQTIGYLSNISLEKGIDTFLYAAEELTKRHPHLDVLIAGPASSSEVRSLVENFVSKDRTHRTYLGPVYGADKERFFTKVDVLLFPTRYRNEAEPLVIFEAARYGTLVMASDMGCICEQIGDAGLVVPQSGDFSSLAVARVDSWIQNPEVFAKVWRATESLALPPTLAELPLQ